MGQGYQQNYTDFIFVNSELVKKKNSRWLVPEPMLTSEKFERVKTQQLKEHKLDKMGDETLKSWMIILNPTCVLMMVWDGCLEWDSSTRLISK